MGEWWKRAPEHWRSGELLLACGATAVADLRAGVAAELNYSCSAGIAHNKACSAASCLRCRGAVCTHDFLTVFSFKTIVRTDSHSLLIGCMVGTAASVDQALLHIGMLGI